jgi:hypothetical protein
MRISIINHTNGQIHDEAVQDVIRAINRQIAEDFQPSWGLGGILRLEGNGGTPPGKQMPADMRGDAVIYLCDETEVSGALGDPALHFQGIPYGFVFTALSQSLGEPWSVTLSHETLALIGDPEVNLLVAGPHPSMPNQDVFHWHEMCDAVQAETYRVDDVALSNFVLPSYFTEEGESGGQNDFLGRSDGGKTLRSFGINPGGSVGFFNPRTGQHETHAMQGDRLAQTRLSIKTQTREARHFIRYGEHADECPPLSAPGRQRAKQQFRQAEAR